MVVEIDYTYDDMKKAVDAVATARWVSAGSAMWWWLLVWIVSIVALAGVAEWVARVLDRSWAPGVLKLLPWLWIAFGIAMIVVTYTRRPEPQPVELYVAGRSSWRPVLYWTLFVGVPVWTFIVMTLLNRASPALPPASRAPKWAQSFLRALPWTLIFAVVLVNVLRNRPRNFARAMWKQPEFQLHYRLEANDLHLAIDYARARVEIRWFVFERFIETPELFLVFTATGIYIIPKRAFADGNAVTEFRDLLRRKIQPSGAGFPINPAMTGQTQ